MQVMPEMRQARARVAAPLQEEEVKQEPKDEPMDTLEGAGSVPLPTDTAAPVTATLAGENELSLQCTNICFDKCL